MHQECLCCAPVCHASVCRYVVNMRQLASLNLEKSGVSGSMPERITSLARLTNLNLAVNTITGSIPV